MSLSRRILRRTPRAPHRRIVFGPRLLGVLGAGGLILAAPGLVPSAAAAGQTLTVTSPGGDARVAGSLPNELAQAKPGDTIDFDLNGGGPASVTLPATLTITTSNLTIIGSSNPQQPPASPLITLRPAATMTGSAIAIENASGVTLQDISLSGFSGDGIELDAGATRTSLVSDTPTPSTISGNGGTGIAVSAAAGPDNRFGGYGLSANGGGPFTVAAPAFGATASLDSTGTQVTVSVSGASPGEPVSAQAGADPGCGGSFDPYPGNTATATADASGGATLTLAVSPPARAPDGVRVLVTGQNDGTVPVAGCVVAALAPAATIALPLPGSIVALGQVVATRFGCRDGAGGPGIRSCTDSEGHSAPTGRLDTAEPGPHTYTVTAISGDGQAASANVAYAVAAPPTIRLSGLRPGRPLRRGVRVRVRYACHEGVGGPGLSACRGSVRSGGWIPTRRTGMFRVTVLALSRDGQVTRMSVRYRVIGRHPPRRRGDSRRPRPPGRPRGR